MLPNWHSGGGISFTVPATHVDVTSLCEQVLVLLSSSSLCDDPSGLPVRGAGTIACACLSITLRLGPAWRSGLVVDDETYDSLHTAIRLK